MNRKLVRGAGPPERQQSEQSHLWDRNVSQVFFYTLKLVNKMRKPSEDIPQDINMAAGNSPEDIHVIDPDRYP